MFVHLQNMYEGCVLPSQCVFAEIVLPPQWCAHFGRVGWSWALWNARFFLFGVYW